MTNSQYISVREAAQLLRITEKKVMDLIDEGDLEAYRIANQFLRLKKSQVMELRDSGTITTEIKQYSYTAQERLRDFFYYNDFYLVSGLLIIILVYVVMSA